MPGVEQPRRESKSTTKAPFRVRFVEARALGQPSSLLFVGIASRRVAAERAVLGRSALDALDRAHGHARQSARCKLRIDGSEPTQAPGEPSAIVRTERLKGNAHARRAWVTHPPAEIDPAGPTPGDLR